MRQVLRIQEADCGHLRRKHQISWHVVLPHERSSSLLCIVRQVESLKSGASLTFVSESVVDRIAASFRDQAFLDQSAVHLARHQV